MIRFVIFLTVYPCIYGFFTKWNYRGILMALYNLCEFFLYCWGVEILHTFFFFKGYRIVCTKYHYFPNQVREVYMS